MPEEALTSFTVSHAYRYLSTSRSPLRRPVRACSVAALLCRPGTPRQNYLCDAVLELNSFRRQLRTFLFSHY